MSVVPKEAREHTGNPIALDIAALKVLARKGAWASTAEADRHGIVTISAHSAKGQRDVLEFKWDNWLCWVSAGWVVPDEAPDVQDRWRIANAGRLNLKRLMSRTPQSSADIISAVRTSKPNKHEIPRSLTQNDAESPLAWLRRRRDASGKPFLSDEEFIAGERLRSDFWFAKMTPSVTANWSPVSAGRSKHRCGASNREADQSDAIADAAERVRAALRAVGPELSGVLIDVCCYFKGMEKVEKGENWPQRTGRVILQHALRALARHYGLVRCADVPDVFADDAS